MRDRFVLSQSSIDNFLWLRFFKMLCLMCMVGCFITWPILFPVNATGGGGQTGLDILSFSNTNPGPRYYAQAIIAWVFLAWVMFLITRESLYSLHLRQRFAMLPFEENKISSRTVLFINVPEEARSDEYLRKRFERVQSVWLVNIPEELADKVEERDQAAAKLEIGETKILKTFVKMKRKKEEKDQIGRSDIQQGEHADWDDVDEIKRPKHRLPVLKVLPLGSKVDTLDWSRNELRRLIPEVQREQARRHNHRSQAQSACFIEFATVEAAQAVFKEAGLRQKAKLTPAELGTHPDDIVSGLKVAKHFPVADVSRFGKTLSSLLRKCISSTSFAQRSFGSCASSGLFQSQ